MCALLPSVVSQITSFPPNCGLCTSWYLSSAQVNCHSLSHEIALVFLNFFFFFLCREACVSVLRFLADILALPFKPNGSGFSQKIEAVITPRGPSLTRLLIGGLVGGLPEYRIEEVWYFSKQFDPK